MEIRGVSSTTAVRPTALQPTEAGAAGSALPSADDSASADAAEKASGAGYISPFLRYDQGARVAVLYFRDFDTGETQDQIPSRRVVEEYRRAAGRPSQEDERRIASAPQTGAAAAANGSAIRTNGAGAAAVPAAGGSGSTGLSFAGTGGVAGGSAPAGTPSAGTPSTGSGAPSAAAGGSFGGSPGGLVSVTV
ncbi:hypothetical protein ABMY26_34085 [Azospirillum sp. HJ39]|uniref:hypothetical protein n=1 Tax=Azospirillum sp. HJ39 TaxID=3159496 RepID=UPI003556AD1C